MGGLFWVLVSDVDERFHIFTIWVKLVYVEHENISALCFYNSLTGYVINVGMFLIDNF